MKLSRISASLLSVAALAVLAACGGGGGGGATPPTTNPGGGSTPTPRPTATASPTPAPTNSPGGGGSITAASVQYNAYDGVAWGLDNWQTNGVTANGDAGDGDTSTGALGNNTVDGISCSLPTGEASGTYYHVHSFLGIYVNGTAYALPDAIGMENPGSGEPVLTFTCAYPLHTHGDSGIIHVEDPSLPVTPSAAQAAKYTLASFADIWGQSLSSLPISGVTGAPQIYTGTPSGKNAHNEDVVTSYTLNTSGASSIVLGHHLAIFLVYGALPTSINGTACPSAGGCLPQVAFGISN